MILADLLGDRPERDAPRPYRPRACPCCGGGLDWRAVVFCRRCEGHRDWCVPLTPVLPRKEAPARYPRLQLVK